MRHKRYLGSGRELPGIFPRQPYHHYVGVFIDLVYRVSDVRLWKIAVVASVYVILRFIEAYGLWYVRPWAEWMAVVSGAHLHPIRSGRSDPASNLVSIAGHRRQCRHRSLHARSALRSRRRSADAAHKHGTRSIGRRATRIRFYCAAARAMRLA